ncbi:hypothetical protein AXF42_Ash002543 [Apostasia shenzhenica]|uniref:Protein cereblon n=1 Tax=Apostasia shenzhenica TaxID=1088818 RepID=A0A2I0ANV1_9ASPA|nr:hypothetical protein AXF42_Ash002543 [Apostasia shenzhenica]
MLYLEGVVLFPEATLPLKVIDPRFKAAVERALHQVDAPYTVGVIRVHRNSDDQRVRFATVGTTAEIRQYRRLADGSLNVVARGQQRFRLIRSWMDVERAPCAEVQIIMEDAPLRTPKDAVTQLAAVSDTKGCNYPRGCASEFSPSKACKKKYNENDWECMSGASFSSDYSDMDVKLCSSATACSCKCERIQECSSSDEEFAHIIGQRRRKPCPCRLSGLYQNCQCRNLPESRLGLDSVEESSAEKISNAAKYGVIHSSSRVPRASMSFWPLWVYQMYDSYSLARKAAGLWRQIIGSPNLDDYITKPGVLSFHIGSKLPVSESTRQELLEIDGITYRLRREIQLLECFNHIRCKGCLALIAKRSDMLVMSSDGPLNAYVNPYGYVHEVITVHNATGLALIGAPVKEHSWFPGYAWTMTNCAVCEKNMGWLFTATKKNLLPKSFWGVRCSQVVDDTQVVQ